MNRLLVNPIAGSGYAKKMSESVYAMLKEKGVEADLVFSEYAGHTTLLAKESAERGDETLFVMGGDGTNIECAKGVYGSKTALGIIPSGTGNDLSRSLCIPKECGKAVEHILSRPPRPMDCAFVNDQLFCNESGTGIDTKVLEYSVFAKKFLRGLGVYMYSLLCSIVTYKPISLEIVTDDGRNYNQKVTILAISNGRFIGGGLEICPIADVYDGLLDVVIIKELSKPGILQMLPKLLSGKIMTTPCFSHFKCKALSVRGEMMSYNTDGELSKADRLEYHIEPGGLTVRA